MRKLIMFNMLTVDGFFEGNNKWDIGWHKVDQEFNDFAIDQLNHSGGLIFGRVTYEGMASFWPSPTAFESDPVVAGLMNELPKYVFTKTLAEASWNNTQLIKGDAIEELKKLKGQPGNDLLIFGSADLSSTFTRHGQIDEFRLMFNPVVLGSGMPLFKDRGDVLKLNLTNTRNFKNGNVLLTYQPDRFQKNIPSQER